MTDQASGDLRPPPLAEHRSSSHFREHVVGRGKASSLTRPPAGIARIGVESRAFSAIPVAISERDPIPEVATPGELLAVTHAIFMTRALSEVLADAGSPANELVVEAECTFAGAVAERELVAVDLRVSGRVSGLDTRTFDEAVSAARLRYLRSSGLHDDVAGEVKAVLQHSGGRL